MVPAIGSRTNAKIVTARAAGLALTLASKAGPGPAPSVHPPGWRGGRACRTLAAGAVTRQPNTSSGPASAQPCPVIAACQAS